MGNKIKAKKLGFGEIQLNMFYPWVKCKVVKHKAVYLEGKLSIISEIIEDYVLIATAKTLSSQWWPHIMRAL